jgi:hypothetical protein
MMMMSKAKLPSPQLSGLGHVGWPALSEKEAASILELVDPKLRQRRLGDAEILRKAEILGEAAISVQWIKRKTAATQSPAQRRRALIIAAKKIAAAVKSIEGLPEATQREIDPKVLRRIIKMTDGTEHECWPGVLQQLHDRTLALAKKITVKRHTGGKKRGPGGGRIEAVQKRAAADCALTMLRAWGNATSLTANKRYFALAALLFKLATGKDGNVRDACEARLQDKTTSAAPFEMWEMLFEDEGMPKVFEDSN